MKIDKLHFGAIMSFVAFLIMVGVMLSGVVYGAPPYPDTLTAWQALTVKMWDQGCRKFEPELADPLETKVYVSAAGIISGIMTSKIRAKCVLYAVKPVVVAPPIEPTPGTTRLTWDAPTSRVNGAPLTASEIRGYSVLLNGVPISFTGATIFEFATPATAGNVTVIAVDTNGLASGESLPYRVCAAC